MSQLATEDQEPLSPRSGKARMSGPGRLNIHLPRSRRGWVAAAQLSPGSLIYLAFFVAPISILFVYSFFHTELFTVKPGFSISNYQMSLTVGLYRTVIIRTIVIGLITAVIVTLLTYPYAYIIRFYFHARQDILLYLVLITLFAGYLVRIYAWETILGAQGLLNSALLSIGLISSPLRFLIFSPFAIIITFVDLLIPIALLPLYSAMQNVQVDVVESARDLGASPFHILRTVLLPLTFPGVRTAFAFAFLLSAGDYVTPALVGGTQGIMVGNVIADQFSGLVFNWPLGAALSFLVVIIVLLVYEILSLGFRYILR